jgi:cyclase
MAETGHLSKRLIPCLDVRNGKLTKGVRFQGNEDIGDPVEIARRYYEQGADEIVFYDITASHEARGIFLDVVERVASVIFIPFSVGGGISTVQDMRAVLLAGAEKVSVNSAAVKNPAIIAEGAAAFGSQAIVVGMDVKQVPTNPSQPSGYEIVIHGGRTHTGLDALCWAKRCEELGAGELCINSIDADGTKNGYELRLTKMITDTVSIPVIASGGAGKPEHLVDAVTKGGASAALVASIVHFGEYPIPELKRFMNQAGVPVRLR